MEAMCFPARFRVIFKSLNTNARSQVIVNGHLTELFSLNRGVRHGDPLSLFLFLIAANPLASALRAADEVIGISILGRNIVTCPSYADEATLNLVRKTSVKAVFKLLAAFTQASWLKTEPFRNLRLCSAARHNDKCNPHDQMDAESAALVGS